MGKRQTTRSWSTSGSSPVQAPAAGTIAAQLTRLARADAALTGPRRTEVAVLRVHQALLDLPGFDAAGLRAAAAAALHAVRVVTAGPRPLSAMEREARRGMGFDPWFELLPQPGTLEASWPFVRDQCVRELPRFREHDRLELVSWFGQVGRAALLLLADVDRLSLDTRWRLACRVAEARDTLRDATHAADRDDWDRGRTRSAAELLYQALACDRPGGHTRERVLRFGVSSLRAWQRVLADEGLEPRADLGDECRQAIGLLTVLAVARREFPGGSDDLEHVRHSLAELARGALALAHGAEDGRRDDPPSAEIGVELSLCVRDALAALAWLAERTAPAAARRPARDRGAAVRDPGMTDLDHRRRHGA